MRAPYLLAFTLFAATATASSPAEAVTLAAADLASRPLTDRHHMRYLSLYHVTERKEQEAWKKVLDFWLNSLSRESELVRAAEIKPGLYRIDLRDYQMPRSAWEKLEDPYFTVKIKGEVAPGVKIVGKAPANGAKRALAPWLPPKEAFALAALSKSKAPVVRADWWLVQTAQQVDRKGVGYYDFLQVKDRTQFQELVGLDQKRAEKLQKEVRAIVSRSGVALNNRQIIRFQSITGPYWVTLDVNKAAGARNAVQNLNGDYVHDAEEVYGTLPNGLFAFFLGDAQGKRQDSAPDNIASDGQAPGNDRRVHAGISCVRCHIEGIRPIKDWGRKVYKGPVSLASPDYEKIKRLRRLYLSNLERYIKKDQGEYAETIHALTGLKVEALARSVGKLHAEYQEADLDLIAVARDAGVTKEQVTAALKWVGVTGLDPVLASLIADDPESIRREHFEEVFPVLMGHLVAHAAAKGKAEKKP